MAEVLYYHSNSVTKALADLFPDIGLDILKFRSSITHKFSSIICFILIYFLVGSFGSKDQRREFFENYAKDNGFNSTIAENWYSQQVLNNLMHVKVFFFFYHFLVL